MSKIQNLIDLLDDKTLIKIVEEDELYEVTGVVPDDSELRRVTEIVFGKSTVLEMLILSRMVYRKLALRYINTI